jgi:hypothetical protein
VVLTRLNFPSKPTAAYGMVFAVIHRGGDKLLFMVYHWHPPPDNAKIYGSGLASLTEEAAKFAGAGHEKSLFRSVGTI